MAKQKPHILITNDDGIGAPGIRYLFDALKELFQVTVIAPSVEQSGTGLAITLRSPLIVQEHDWGGSIPVYCVSGTPADSVKMGVSVILPEPPDMVVSGINRGSNAGRNLLYSGTVACAIEASLSGIPAVAFSCHDHWDTDYKTAQKHVPTIVNYLFEHPLPKGSLLNVNFPSNTFKEIRGYRMTRQGREYWKEDPEERSHPTKRHAYYWLSAKLAQYDEHEDSDIAWLRKGYVAASPIHIDELTDHTHLASKRTSFDSLFPE